MQRLHHLFLAVLATSTLAACGGGGSSALPATAPTPSGGSVNNVPTPPPNQTPPPFGSQTPTPPPPPPPPPTTGGSGLAGCPQKNIQNVTAADIACMTGQHTGIDQIYNANSGTFSSQNKACSFTISDKRVSLTVDGKTVEGNTMPASYLWNNTDFIFTLRTTSMSFVGDPAFGTLAAIGNIAGVTHVCGPKMDG